MNESADVGIYINVYQHVIHNIAHPPLIKRCAFCKSENRIFTEEHVFPSSLGNEKTTRPLGVVCKCCNGKFSHIENKFVQTYPNVIWRLFTMNNKVDGKPTRIGISGGFIRRVEVPYSLPIIEINKRDTQREVERLRSQFNSNVSRFYVPDIEFRSENSQVSSRVLAKISLELLCLYFPNKIFSSDFDTIRNYAIKAAENNVEFIPYAWGIHMGQPFLNGLYEMDKKWGICSDIYAYFTIPGVKYLFPLTHPLNMDYFLSIAEEMSLSVVPNRRHIRNVYSFNFIRV